jgi:PKD repeat protein
MRKLLLFFAFAFLSLLSGAQIIVSGEITSNTTWNNDNIYILSGFVYVRDGATLTIEPGTLIKGDFNTKGSLIIERGGKIIADGTAQQPIVFTSQKAAGQRSYGDWGGVILCGRASVNSPANAANGTVAGEAVIEGGVGSVYGGGATPNDDDNSGVLRYVRIEFGGIPFQPNNEVNGLTCGGVGRGTTIENVMVSYCGDDAFEFFGGTVNAKNLIAYRTWDDDFDTDFGYRGNLQFLFSLRDPAIADQSGSNGFESDNDATGTSNTPITRPVFSNVTIVGPYVNNATINANYRRGAHIRRNSSASIFNSVIAGYPTGLLVESSLSQTSATNGDLRIKNTIWAGMGDSLATLTSANPNNVNGSFNINDWFGTAGFNNALVNTYAELGWNNSSLTSPDLTLANGSLLSSGASFTDSYLTNSFFTPVSYRGAFGSEDWTSCWAEWDPQNELYNSALDNTVSMALSADGSLSFCEGGSVMLEATSIGDVVFHWSNGAEGSTTEVATAGTYTVYAENANNCTSAEQSVTVEVYELPVVSISADGNTSFCTGGSVTLSADQSGEITWSNNQTGSSISVSSSGVYSCNYVDANGCSASSNSISINVSDSPAPSISSQSSTTICDGASVTLQSSSADSYAWYLNGTLISGATSQTIDATEEGIYEVLVTNADACNGVGTSDPIFISVNPSPTAAGTASQSLNSATVQFNNESLNATSVIWNFGDGNSSTLFNPSYTYAAGGDYVVTLTAFNGSCENSITINLNSVSVGELNNAGAVVAAYPNPVSNMLFVDLNESAARNAVVAVYNVVGELQATMQVQNESRVEVDFSSFSSGIYFVSVRNEEAVIYMQKIVKQ